VRVFQLPVAVTVDRPDYPVRITRQVRSDGLERLLGRLRYIGRCRNRLGGRTSCGIRPGIVTASDRDFRSWLRIIVSASGHAQQANEPNQAKSSD
jgi:hypothetical protein